MLNNKQGEDVNTQLWTSKYRPQKERDLIGNETAIRTIKNWLESWPRGVKRGRRALLLYGPTGVGKTVAVYVIALELGFEITEINASDKRSKKILDNLLRRTVFSGTLFGGRGRIVLIDELAGLSGKADRGGASALRKYIANPCSTYPDYQ